MNRNKSSPFVRFVRLSGVLSMTACALEGTADPPMDVEHFDPSKSLEAARAFAGPASELLEFEARFVRSDGTMDLTAEYHPSLQYEFIRPSSNVETAPIGTGVNNRAFELIEVSVHEPRWVHVERIGGGCSGTFDDLGMQREVSFRDRSEFDRRTAAPTCSLAQVWAAARAKRDIPATAVAVIEFSGAGYEFSISDLQVELWFTPSCEPLDEDAFSAREDEQRRSPEERERLAKQHREDERLAQEDDAARQLREAERDAALEEMKREALAQIRAAKARSAKTK